MAAKARILIVEDEILVARELEARLKAMGYAVEGIAASAEEAFQMADEIRPDLVLMDIVLRGSEDGIVAANRIRAHSGVPTIYVTAYCDDSTLERAKESDPYGYIIKPFAESELRATLEIALRKRQTDLQLQKAHLELADLAQQLRLRNEELEEELNLAHQMQIAMLPSRFPNVPQGAQPWERALACSSIYTPSGKISGDFDDVVRISENVVGVFICDVMGHNVSAALVTAMIRALIEEYSNKADAADPGKLMTHVNRVLARIFEQNCAVVFATAFYLVADVANSKIRYANAAHPSPLYLSPSHGDASPIQCAPPGPALGLFKETVYSSCEHPMEAGDSVMFYTDGLFEMEGPGEVQYSQERLVETVRTRLQLPTDKLFSEVMQDVRQFAQGREMMDDICLVGMEVRRCGPRVFGVEEDHGSLMG
jgi:serine phosphatase RsbU (regulator of sigma subunit)